MSRRNAKTNNRPNANETCVLKHLHDDIVRATSNETLTTKMMRVWLRANMRDVHERNSSWTFTQSQYDRVRSHFDPKYAQSLKRNTKSRATTTRKRNVKTNDAPNVEPANVE